MPCDVVPCRAVRYCAVLCRAVPCVGVIFLSNIPDYNASKQTELARVSMSSSILYSSVEHLFSHFLGGAFLKAGPAYSSSMHEYAVVECQNREHSKAQHSAITPAQGSKPSTCLPEYISKEVCTYMHAASGCFPGAWSSWHLQVTHLHLKCWTIYYIRYSNPFFLASGHSGRNLPLHEAPCINLLRFRLLRRTSSVYTPTSQPFSACNCRRVNDLFWIDP